MEGRELRTVLYYAGLIAAVVAVLMLVPLTVALLSGERAVALDFAFSLSVAAGVGFGLMLLRPRTLPDLTWAQGMVAAALSWLIAAPLAAVPYWLSGQWLSYVDAVFDVMSGLTTTGLTLIQDVDFTSNGINMWRHFLSWLGGQGMIVLALTFLVRSLPGAVKFYIGEAKEERLEPNIVHTARAIWYISVVYLLIGWGVLGLLALRLGMAPARAALHGLWVFLAGWSTGGFAPMAQSVLYYHDGLFELAVTLFMVLGSLNFNLHWVMWTRDRREIWRNLETVTFASTLTVLAALAMWELGRRGLYTGAVALLRKGYFQLVSAHTGTGFVTLPQPQLLSAWGPLALTAIIIAMLLGGSASSTSGGFKAFRVGLIAKSVAHDVRRLLAPESAVVIQKFHMFREAVLDDRLARTALTVVLLYMLTWAVGTAAGAAAGFDLTAAAFEAASVTSNAGLTVGITSPNMPVWLKIVYIFVMWLGRLEFMSVFVLFAHMWRRVWDR